MGRKPRHRDMICARCGEATLDNPCSHCGQSPVLDERYVLQKILGTGSEGTTYRAQAIEGGKIVAVKEMPLRQAKDDKARELLQREARILRQLHHQAIPDHLDDFIAGKGKTRAFYLVQEYIDGHTLASELDDHRYDLAEVLAILDELLDVLVYLHRLSPPVIHRDIKPSNVMRRDDGRLVLIDFGSVRDALVDLDVGGATVTGTFGYMAPEQMMGDASEGSDLYGLGALAIRLLSRREPHTLLRHDRTLDWEPHVQTPRPIRQLLRSLLEPDPGKRKNDASKVRDEVRWLRQRSDLDEDDAGPRSTSPVTDLLALVTRKGPGAASPRSAESTRSSRLLVGTVAVWLLAVGAAFAGYTLFHDSEPVEPEDSPTPGPVVPARIPDEPPAPTVVHTEVTPTTVSTYVDVGVGTYPARGGEIDPTVTIVVFSDFECSYCVRIAASLAQVDEAFGDEVALYFRDFPLDIHPDSYDAHEAGRCAQEQGQFWAMHDKLFEHQGALDRDHLTGYAADAALDRYRFDDCMRSGATRLDIEIDRKAGREAGVKGTPTFFVNGSRHSGAIGFERLSELVTLQLAQARMDRAAAVLERAGGTLPALND